MSINSNSNSGFVGVSVGQQNTTGVYNTAIGYTAFGLNELVMVYIGAPYGYIVKKLTIGKQYIVRENYGSIDRDVTKIRYEFMDDFGKVMSLGSTNFCTVGEWRSKQLDSILDEK